MRAILIDTGIIVAALDHRQHAHQAVVSMLENVSDPLITCEAVITEACHLLRHTPGGPSLVLSNVEASVFQPVFRLAENSDRVKAIMHKYHDIPASFADACLICLAEESQTGEILTLDSDFAVYRWARNRPFRLLMEI